MGLVESMSTSMLGLRSSALSWGLDAAAAVAVVGFFWVPALTRERTQGDLALWGVLAGLVCVSVMLRWKLPAISTVVAIGATTVGWTSGLGTDPLLAAAWCLYPMALQRAPRSRVFGLVAIAALVALAATMAPPLNDPVLGQRIVNGICALGASWLLGHVEARRQAAVAAMVREQERSERARQQSVMAREVHDVVGHALSFISIEADAARTLPGTTETELRESLANIEQRARGALEEVQALVRSLRTGQIAPDGQALVSLPDLLAAARASGLQVDASITTPELPAELDLAVTRIVQEGLSNIVRHSGADRCEVAVWSEDDRIAVRVDDNGAGIHADDGPGNGLSGMRERVAELGGELTISTRLEGGTRLLAHLPIGRAA